MNRIPSLLKKSWPVLVLLTASLLVRLFIALRMHPIIHTDSITFFFLREVDMVRTPSYPLFIEVLLTLNDLFSFTDRHFWFICLGQLFILGILNSYLVFRLAGLFTESRLFALAMGIVYNFNYFVVGFEVQIMTETLSITFLLAVLVLYVQFFKEKKTFALLAGALSVLLVLTRATYLVFFFVLPVVTFVAYHPRSRGKALFKETSSLLVIFLAVNVAGIGAWSLRNGLKYGYFGISSLMPYQLRYYTNNFFEKYKPSGDELLDRVAAVYAEELGKTEHPPSAVSNFHLRLAEEMNLNDAEISKAFLKVNLKLIKDYPGEYLRQLPASFLSYYRQYSPYWTAGNNRKLFRGGELVPRVFRFFFAFYQKLFMNPVFLAFLLLGAPLILVLKTFKRKDIFHGWLLVLAAVHYNCFVSILSTSAGINNLRYRVPAEPLLLLAFYAAVFYLLKFFLDLARKKARPGQTA